MKLGDIAVTAVLVSVALTGSIAGGYKLSASSNPRAEISARYDQMNSAYASNNMESVAKILTSDYTETDPKGHVSDRNAALKKLRDMRSFITRIQSKTTVNSCAPQPNGELVQMTFHAAGTGQKKVLFIKLKGTFTNDMIAKDLWVNTADGWRLRSRVLLADETKQRAA